MTDAMGVAAPLPAISASLEGPAAAPTLPMPVFSTTPSLSLLLLLLLLPPAAVVVVTLLLRLAMAAASEPAAAGGFSCCAASSCASSASPMSSMILDHCSLLSTVRSDERSCLAPSSVEGESARRMAQGKETS